jgi:5-methylcytosine-specific restriction endonuclease McrA
VNEDPVHLNDVVALAVALVQGRNDKAEGALERLAWVPTPMAPRPEPSIRVIAQVFQRDGYECRYCGQRVVLTAALRLLARLYPQVIPYHRNWRIGMTHPIFSLLSATLDHVEPVATGGDPLDLGNLVCACWACNRRKGDLSVASLGWSLRPHAQDAWRGLADLYVPLWEAVGKPTLSEYEREWMRAVVAAAE